MTLVRALPIVVMWLAFAALLGAGYVLGHLDAKNPTECAST